MALTIERLITRRGIEGDLVAGGAGPDLVFFHAAGGVTTEDPLVNALAERHRVYAPVWPGFGTDETEIEIEDMLDFTLHGWDLVDALELDGPPLIVGHSMGAMIAAEMASVARTDLRQLVLLTPAGMWIDAEPTPDIFAMLPFEMAEVLFHDPILGEKLLTGGQDFSNNDALTSFMVANARRMGTAGKILFPIPNRRLSKRIHRIGVSTLVVGGASDGLVPSSYIDLWHSSIADSTVAVIEEAGHMLHLEQPAAVAQAIFSFAHR
jgi:pimeloyl-ACP methyl ester carboxylesterase